MELENLDELSKTIVAYRKMLLDQGLPSSLVDKLVMQFQKELMTRYNKPKSTISYMPEEVK